MLIAPSLNTVYFYCCEDKRIILTIDVALVVNIPKPPQAAGFSWN